MDLVPLLRAAFPEAEVGGGSLTNFTEFNRCRPDPEAVDFVTFGTTAIVHAADDRAVLETLEALPAVFDSAERSRLGATLHLGLVSIGMRSNPYGAAVADESGRARGWRWRWTIRASARISAPHGPSARPRRRRVAGSRATRPR